MSQDYTLHTRVSGGVSKGNTMPNEFD